MPGVAGQGFALACVRLACARAVFALACARAVFARVWCLRACGVRACGCARALAVQLTTAALSATGIRKRESE